MISARTIGAAVCLALVVASYWGAYQHGRSTMDVEWGKEWGEKVAEFAEGQARAVAQVRSEEQRRYAAQEKVRNDAREERDVADAGAAGADAAGRRLRDEAVRLAERAGACSADPASVARGQAATRAAMVLSDLLARSVDTNRGLAAAYDRARIAGLACEASYGALTR